MRLSAVFIQIYDDDMMTRDTLRLFKFPRSRWTPELWSAKSGLESINQSINNYINVRSKADK